MVIQEVKNKLKNNDIKKGDAVCIFSDITSFGIPSSLRNETRKKGINYLLDSYLDTFKTVVGRNGLVMMPTFTYSATKKEIFDVINSPSTVGTLTEYFRKKKNVKRSIHPIFSFAAWGKNAGAFLNLDTFDCFGRGSLFDKLFNANAYYILFGINMQKGASFIYYSEQKLKVYYRYFKNFSAVIQKGRKKLRTKVGYFVRSLDLKYKDYWYNLEKRALQTKTAKLIRFSGGNILVMKSQDIHGLIRKELNKNKNFLIKL